MSTLSSSPNITPVAPSEPPSATPATNVPVEVSAQQAQDWMQSGKAILIDVRESDEHARERIAGSVLLPLSGFDAARAVSMAKPGQTVVLHCRSGRRSAEAYRLAATLGERGVSVVCLSGGIEAWKSASLPVEVDATMSGLSIMRQVQLVVGSGVFAGSMLAWLVHPGFLIVPAFFGAGLAFAGATGTCALASILSMMPWNRGAGGSRGASCASGSCSGSACGGR